MDRLLLRYVLSLLLILLSPHTGSAQERPSVPLSQQSSPVSASFSTSSDVPAGTNENWQGSYGLPGTEGTVRAMIRYQNQLIVAGQFRAIAGTEFNYIARWDGSEWQPLGDGTTNGTDGPVYALALIGSRLYVGGSFRSAGGTAARNIASFDLASGRWSSLDNGIGGTTGSAVLALAAEGNNLYAGGRFVVAGTTVAVNVARWDGARWHRVGTGINKRVDVLKVDAGTLFAGGAFTIAGDVPAMKAARYQITSNRWEPLPGLDLGNDEAVADFAFDDDYVYIGGRFLVIGNRPVNNIARLNRQTGEWSDLDRGITNQRKNGQNGVLNIDPDGIGEIVIRTMEMHGDKLYVGGDFDNLVSNPRLYSEDSWNQPRDMAAWNRATETWSMFPKVSSSGIHHASSGVVKGARSISNSSDLLAYAIRDDQSTVVYTLLAGGGDSLYIGGTFDMAGPLTILNDARAGASAIYPEPETTLAANICLLSQNDTVWSPLGAKGLDGTVRALVTTTDFIYAGGTLTRAGDQAVRQIARLDRRTGKWEPLGEGVSGRHDTLRHISAIAVQGDHVYVGGTFTTAGSVATGGLAEWNASTRTWSRPGSHTYEDVTALKADGNDLIAVGDAGLGIWNGTSWKMVPNGPNGMLYALAVYGDSIFVGGKFSEAGGIAAKNIALWNRKEERWEPLRGGVDDTVFAMDVYEGNLFVGGAFLYADGHYSRNLASWDIDVALWDAVGRYGLEPITFTDYNVIRTVHSGRYGVYVGGLFQATAESPLTGRASNIALWDGSAWRPLGSGVTRFEDRAMIYTLESDSSFLYVGGLFDYAGITGSPDFAVWSYPKSGSGGQDQTDPTRSIASEASGDSDETNLRSPIRSVGRSSHDYHTLLSSLAISSNSSSSGSVSADEDDRWDDRFGPYTIPTGANDEIFTMASSGDELFIGGTFTNVVGLEANAIATWDGSDWRALDNGTGNGVDGFVFDLLVDGDNVYVGGQFSHAGGIPAKNIARWNRTSRTWHDLGEGIGGDGSSTPYISSLAMKDGVLYAGGSFTRAGSVDARSVARWDGTSWSRLRGGVDGTVNALRFFQGKLFVGGTFGKVDTIGTSGIAWWENDAWHSTGVGVDGSINDFDEWKGRLLLAGQFRKDSLTNAAAWIPNSLQGGFIPILPEPERLTEIRDLFVDSSARRIYVGGSYRFTPTDTLNSQQVYQGTVTNIAYNFQQSNFDPVRAWSPWITMSVGTDGPVNAMALFRGHLVAGGLFSKAGGRGKEIICQNIARYDLRYRIWRTLVSGQALGTISALTKVNGEIYAVGPFTEKEDPTQHLNEENHIARLGSRGWNRIDGIITGDAYTATTVGDQILYGGSFVTSREKIGVNLALFSPATEEWRALSPGNGVASQEDLAYVNTIAVDTTTGSDRIYYIGGKFDVVDTFETRNIAIYNATTDQWSALGKGLDGQVWSIAVAPDGSIYAGGEFRFSGSTLLSGIAHWNGTVWEPVGEGVNGDVHSLLIVDDNLYVGGTFSSAGNRAASNIARRDLANNTWSSLGEGVAAPFLPSVESMAWTRGKLFVGGFFETAGDIAAENIARWDGSGWANLGSGTDHAVWSIVPLRDEVYVAGPFRHTGGKPSPYVGLWHDPTLSVDPVRHSPLAGSMVIGPNPAFRETTINYTIPQSGRVEIVICNLEGVVVDHLFEGEIQGGEHRLIWQVADDLPGGLYFCRMRYQQNERVQPIVIY